jgi:hypothetical protein
VDPVWLIIGVLALVAIGLAWIDIRGTERAVAAVGPEADADARAAARARLMRPNVLDVLGGVVAWVAVFCFAFITKGPYDGWIWAGIGVFVGGLWSANAWWVRQRMVERLCPTPGAGS